MTEIRAPPSSMVHASKQRLGPHVAPRCVFTQSSSGRKPGSSRRPHSRRSSSTRRSPPLRARSTHPSPNASRCGTAPLHARRAAHREDLGEVGAHRPPDARVDVLWPLVQAVRQRHAHRARPTTGDRDPSEAGQHNVARGLVPAAPRDACVHKTLATTWRRAS